MADIKIGDRVHVAYEGFVAAFVEGENMVEVKNDDGVLANELVADCTVIVPPIKVGDTVTEANVEQLDSGSIVAKDDFGAAIQNYGMDRWASADHVFTTAQVVALERLRVLRIGGSSSSPSTEGEKK